MLLSHYFTKYGLLNDSFAFIVYFRFSSIVKFVCRLEMAVPGNPCPNSQRILHRSCDISATFCFFGEDKINGNSPSTVLDETLSHVSVFRICLNIIFFPTTKRFNTICDSFLLIFSH